VTVAVPAPTRRALAAFVGLSLACWSGVVAAAPADEGEVAVDEAPADPTLAPVDIPPNDTTSLGPAEIAEDVESESEVDVEEDVEAEAEPDPEDTEPLPEPTNPPRFDGPYVGALVMGTANFAKVIDLSTPAPLLGAGGFLQAGDAVFPWMSIGVAIGGQAGWIGKQQIFQGALLVEFGFVPAKRYPLSIRTGFGFGGGAVTEQGIDRRFGYGGALFKGSLRYEFFPLADRKRPDRGGGWAIGPELGWLGATPAGKGQPFVNTILLGLSTSFYFGS
jgi:hypothetical protein